MGDAAPPATHAETHSGRIEVAAGRSGDNAADRDPRSAAAWHGRPTMI